MGFEGSHWGKRKMVKESVFISEHFLHRYGFLFTLPGFLCWSFAGGSELIHSTTLKEAKNNIKSKRTIHEGYNSNAQKSPATNTTQPCISAAATTTITAHCQSARKEREEIPTSHNPSRSLALKPQTSHARTTNSTTASQTQPDQTAAQLTRFPTQQKMSSSAPAPPPKSTRLAVPARSLPQAFPSPPDGKSSKGPDVALIPGAAGLALMAGGSSAMTGIFSSEVRSCSEEVLAAAVGGSGLLSVAAVAGDDAAAAGLPFGLAFSVAEGSVGLMVGGETTGAAAALASSAAPSVLGRGRGLS